MPIELKRFAEVYVPVTVSVLGDDGRAVEETLDVWIRPISPALRAEQAEKVEIERRNREAARESEDDQAEAAPAPTPTPTNDGADEGAVVATVLAELVTRWSITEEGQPVRPSADSLKRLDDSVLMAIYEAIQRRHNTSPD